MNRINQLFNSNKKDLLSIYFCAGDPTLDGTADVIRTLEKHGVSMIEVGIPFSDPMADGIVIQNAATQALRNGMSLKVLFEQLRNIRRDVKIPLVLMGYLNPIMQFGFENFCRKCVECGIDGVIIPDLPFHDYQERYRIIAERYGIKVIMLITPETSEERVREIAIGYVTELLGRFRELGIDFNTTQTIFLGGGSILMAEFIQIVWKRYGGEYSVINDTKANAKGYRLQYQVEKKEERK